MADLNPTLGLIVNTTATCKVRGQSWAEIPTLVWPDGIDEVASDWLRALIVELGVATSSAHEYANIIRPFLRFCRQRKRRWDTVSDEFLVIWREHLLRTKELSTHRVNTSLQTIFSFYRWAEERKIVRYHVGIYSDAELPGPLVGVPFPISAKRVNQEGKNGRVFSTWATPLTVSSRSEDAGARHTPTEEQIQDLHEVAAQHQQGERDSIMLSWAEEAGPRLAEILRVRRCDLPTLDELADLIERDEPWIISLRRKGGKSKPLNIPPDLLVRTLDYVQFARRKVVDRCLEKIVGYREPEEVFLSSTTGLVLHPDSVTSIGRRIFGRAGVRKASLHRLRARFAVRTIETLVDAIFNGSAIGSESSWIETILIKAAEQMGHSNPSSLRPYLTYVLNRRIQNSDASRAARLEVRLRQGKLLEGTLVRRLGEHEQLHLIARHIQAGHRAKAALAARQLISGLEK